MNDVADDYWKSEDYASHASWTPARTVGFGDPMWMSRVFRHGEAARIGCVVECTPFQAVEQC